MYHRDQLFIDGKWAAAQPRAPHGALMDPAAPFGGVKNSGYGREPGSEGIGSYTVSQSISVAAQTN